MKENHMLSFWRDKRVLITGHTGFKGGWLTLWLKELGATICGVSLAPDTTPALFDLANVADGIDHNICDIRDRAQTIATIQKFDPEIVLHLAAQPLVRAGYRDPLQSFDTNVIGTANVLEALRENSSVQTILVITTDKVYENLETGQAYNESDRLGGHDPYSASKAACEIVVQSYRQSYFHDLGIGLATARAGNVIGGGDWSEDRLIPDAIRAWQSGQTLEIRSPESVRPWQHVLEPIQGYLTLAQRLWENSSLAQAYNFGPREEDARSVRQVVELAKTAFGAGKVNYGTNTGPHEAGLLMLDIQKAAQDLQVEPLWTLETAVEKTVAWYVGVQNGADANELCRQQIKDYCA